MSVNLLFKNFAASLSPPTSSSSLDRSTKAFGLGFVSGSVGVNGPGARLGFGGALGDGAGCVCGLTFGLAGAVVVFSPTTFKKLAYSLLKLFFLILLFIPLRLFLGVDISINMEDDDQEYDGIPWGYIIAAVIVDGLIQIPVTSITSFVLSHYNLPVPNCVLWWLGMVIFYCSLNYWHPIAAGRILLIHCGIILLPLIAIGLELLQKL